MKQFTEAQWIEHYRQFGLFDGIMTMTDDLKNLRAQRRSKVPLSSSQENQLRAIRSLLDPMFERDERPTIPVAYAA